ncbi:hypothetical protein EVAR_95327_1 [Eumeta japonica]|uniref:Uncharacterized protein n=1 Tax=Eumeta variegata TaxID=151549 RepID=A0A4C1UA37_EUMVA|nr:hypothetical protein EVAR_95327_1 [Eumeta japonica]
MESLRLVTAVSNSSEDNVTVTCARDHAYDNLDINTVLRKWYSVELYLHLSTEGRIFYKTCPMITLWMSPSLPRSTYGPSTENVLYHVQHINAKFRHEYRHLRLLWDEAGRTIEYSLYFRNDSVGYWQVFDAQNGTLTSFSTYQQFSGTIQVLKAVHDHLLLNFCQEPRDRRPAQLYSVLFSREPGMMERRDVELVHTLLENKRLSVASRRMRSCRKGPPRYSNERHVKSGKVNEARQSRRSAVSFKQREFVQRRRLRPRGGAPQDPSRASSSRTKSFACVVYTVSEVNGLEPVQWPSSGPARSDVTPHPRAALLGKKGEWRLPAREGEIPYGRDGRGVPFLVQFHGALLSRTQAAPPGAHEAVSV